MTQWLKNNMIVVVTILIALVGSSTSAYIAIERSRVVLEQKIGSLETKLIAQDIEIINLKGIQIQHQKDLNIQKISIRENSLTGRQVIAAIKESNKTNEKMAQALNGISLNMARVDERLKSIEKNRSK